MASSLVLDRTQSALAVPTVHRLANGLTIIAQQMAFEAVNLNLWLRVGSVVEPDSINGMAHFLEHMIFKGTPELACGEFERLIEARGALTNAATSQDYTHFYLTTAPQDFAALAPLQLQLVLNPRLTDDDFERERPVILEEIRRAYDNPHRRTFYHAMELAFDRLPYRRPVLGPVQVVETLTAQQMREFHRRWYQSEQMTAVVVGHLPVEQLIDTVVQGFEAAQSCRQSWSPHADTESRLNLTREHPFTTIQRRHHCDRTLQQAQLVMSWRVPGMADLMETHALDVLASVLGRGRLARLVRDLREERGWVSSVSASNLTYGQQGAFTLFAQLPVEHLERVEAIIVDHIRHLQNQPITIDELARVCTQVSNGYVFGSETPSDRAGLYGYYHTLTGTIDHALDYPARIQALSPAEIQAAAQQYLDPDAYGLVVMQPEAG
ncbi:putative zinc protease [Halomicronema hongdechloris C2206]|uniref:Zinc protease n=1 Tax=Halomicronema hongdechloris C2206 TaxID=1641165 RepID=A0A1Z3HN05_9CYAN|nr:pitrilysin family protein [Halomicronema hongdechloris]ASC71670.1 putative zinc protease [Halomicronema hongdechloris C2206]